ncbi:MAG: stimulus-sensing domain-containing protein [Bdellovibrionales bacterium]
MALATGTRKPRSGFVAGLRGVFKRPVAARISTARGLGGRSARGVWLRRAASRIATRWHPSPLMLRIFAVNTLALAILVGSLLYLGRYQDRIIQSEIEDLLLQSRIGASAVAEGAVVISDDDRSILSPLLARLMVRRLAETTETRTRLFDTDSTLLADSRILLGNAGKIQSEELEGPDEHMSVGSRLIESLFDVIDLIPEREKYPLYPEEDIQRGDQSTVVKRAAQGEKASQVWSLPNGGLMLTVAVPVQHYKQVMGVLMLSRSGAKIDDAIHAVRVDILKVFAMTLLITFLLSLYLARAIARPIRRLAAAAEGIRHGQMQINGLGGTASLLNRDAIPDLTRRQDEIGDLSGALRNLTDALAKRIGAIENFAADVAHEIKNPLTSLRSAVETAERVQDPAMQKKLMLLLRDDVDRLDRLITDIAHASRLDAELSRAEAAPINVGDLLNAIVDLYRSAVREGMPRAEVIMEPMKEKLVVMAIGQRIVQVLRNLIDNAISFSPPHEKIVLSADREGRFACITIEDKGPGIPENKLDAIFDRFYSERPKDEKFGTHSGLGLSISKQIVEAHHGTIRAENCRDAAGNPVGARFIVQLPGVVD